LAPPTRLEPFTVKVVEDVDPEAFSKAVPRTVLPAEKVTLPVGATVPEAGLTVAVRTVDAVAAILAGAAVATMVVAGRAGVTVTVTAAEVELTKFPVAT